MRLTNDQDLATYVRTRRRELGLSQEQLGERAGLRRATVTDIEQARSHPSFATATALLAALGVTLTTYVPNSATMGGGSPGPARPDLDTVLDRLRDQ
jgi:HTH-type transcriptional regulator / antitoxin HipB